jgi:hypothetical protein
MSTVCKIAYWLDIRDGLRNFVLSLGNMAFFLSILFGVQGLRQEYANAALISIGCFAAWWAWFIVRVLANMHRDNLSTERPTDD